MEGICVGLSALEHVVPVNLGLRPRLIWVAPLALAMAHIRGGRGEEKGPRLKAHGFGCVALRGLKPAATP